MNRFMGALLLGLLVAMPSIPGDLEARQRQGPERREMTREQMEERVMREFESRIAEALGLDASSREAMRTALEEFRSRRAPLLQERLRTQARMRRHLNAEGSDEEARAILASLRSLRVREVALQGEEEERLLTILTPGQLLRLHHMRDQFAQRIRRLESGGPRTEAGPRPRGGGPGAPEPSGH